MVESRLSLGVVAVSLRQPVTQPKEDSFWASGCQFLILSGSGGALFFGHGRCRSVHGADKGPKTHSQHG